MNESMLIWVAVVSIVLLAFVFRAIEKFREENNASQKPLHCLELGEEKDVFYCPGDEWYECEDL